MVEVFESGVFADFVFQSMNWTGGVDRFDGAAVGADEIVSMMSRNDESEVSGAFVQSETTDKAIVGEAMQEAVDGGFVALAGEPR